MQIFGVLCGIFSGFISSMGYFFSGVSMRYPSKPTTLDVVARSHAAAGVVSVLGIALYWHPQLFSMSAEYMPQTLGICLAYILGQVCFFMAQKDVDSSRAVPLITCKLFFLAFINSYVLKSEQYRLPQFLAIVTTLVAASLLVNRSTGRKVTPNALGYLLITTIAFAISDTIIIFQLRGLAKLPGIGSIQAAALGTFLTYATLGLFSLLALAFASKQPKKIWLPASAVGVFQVTSIVILCVSFKEIGTVNGGIAQNTRCIFAVILGVLASKLGMSQVEEKVSRKVIINRLCAAILMLLSVALFNLFR